MRHLLSLLLCLSPLAVAGADPAPFGGASVTLRQFVLREFRATGALAWVLTGEQAWVDGNQVRLRGMRIRFQEADGQEAEVRSPGCEFDNLTRTARSEEPIIMRRHNLVLEGVGYDLDIPSRRLQIRRQVVLRAWRAPAAELGATP